MKKVIKITILFILFQIIYIPLVAIGLIYYGPFTHVKEMIVTTAMTTMTQQYFATWFLSDEEIESILAKNRPIEDIADQNLSDIEIDKSKDLSGMELIDISSSTYTGKLLIVNDPSRVELAVAPRLGEVGATTSQIVEHYGAIAGINAGGFQDDALGTGGKPSDLLMIDTELLSGTTYTNYRVVGIDADDKLIVSNSISYKTLATKNVEDAVAFGPTIIINGMPTISSGSDGGWGIQPRTAIAQTKDGTILLLTIDGRQTGSIGATLKNVQDILLQYGAYNAFNLDGGASTTMVYNNEVVNSPSDIMGERYVPCAFIVNPVVDEVPADEN